MGRNALRPGPRVGVVDIGTNSMRLLITDGVTEHARRVEVTGLGRGVDAEGRFSEEAMRVSIEALAGYGRAMDELGVERRMAIATSASRDAANRDELFDAAESVLGVRPRLISGEREGALAYEGVTAHVEAPSPVVVSDIGGGSTEIVTEGSVVSVEVGSVRLTERVLRGRPPAPGEAEEAGRWLEAAFASVPRAHWASHIGVAGTWTSVAAMVHEAPRHAPEAVEGASLTRDQVSEVVAMLSSLTVAETKAIPALAPERAPVILAGAMVAGAVMDALGVGATIVSVRDTLDGAAIELMGIR